MSNPSNLKVSRNAPWLGVVERASYRPGISFLSLLVILNLIWLSLETVPIPFPIQLAMMSTFIAPAMVFFYLLRFVRTDLYQLREFDPALPDFSELVAGRWTAILELVLALVFASVMTLVLGGIVYTVSLPELLRETYAGPNSLYYLYLLLWLMNLCTSLMILFAIRLVHLMMRYAAQIRISIFRYRIYSTFSGIFVIFFTGVVIIASLILLLGPFLNFDGWLTTLIFLLISFPVSFLVSLPIFRIARRMDRAKAAEQARVERLIDEEAGKKSDSINPELERLLAYERQVLDIWVWPFSTQIKRMLLFGLLPPITWLLGALIEIVLEGTI